jgi:hypothetical protein
MTAPTKTLPSTKPNNRSLATSMNMLASYYLE